MTDRPRWDLVRAQRIAADLNTAGVPAFAETIDGSDGPEVYLSLGFNHDMGDAWEVIVWFVDDQWQVDVGSVDHVVFGSAGSHPPEDLSDTTLAGLLLGEVIRSGVGLELYAPAPEDIDPTTGRRHT